jgi:two-component system chemotaxis response regulator CheY
MFDRDMTVLVVDDSSVMRRIIRAHLQAMGMHNVIEAKDGREALQIVDQEDVGLVLSDWCMQVMHGIEVLKTLRARETTRDIPFIMITAEAQPHLMREAMNARVSEYVVKPFTRKDLVQSIEKVFKLERDVGQ